MFVNDQSIYSSKKVGVDARRLCWRRKEQVQRSGLDPSRATTRDQYISHEGRLETGHRGAMNCARLGRRCISLGTMMTFHRILWRANHPTGADKSAMGAIN